MTVALTLTLEYGCIHTVIHNNISEHELPPIMFQLRVARYAH